MKFEFKTDLIETRTINKPLVVFGLASAATFAIVAYNYFTTGKIGLVDTLAKWMDMSDYAQIMYAFLLILLAVFVVPMLYNVFRKKRVAAGKIYFDEETLFLKDKGEVYKIPQDKLDELRFELKKLPAGKVIKTGKVQGGNFMTIPMGNNEHTYELQIDSEAQKQDLLNMVEFLKINHDIKVKVKEVEKK